MTTSPAQADPQAWFPGFYTNPAIRSLAGAQRWTISGQLGDLVEDDDPSAELKKRKAPIDVRHLIDGCTSTCRHSGPVRGAWATDERCLITLDELSRSVPGAANTAFYLQAQTDGVLVVDIEPDCPPSTATDLLRLPGILYQELSMSGRGFHLVMPLPLNFHDFPVAASKRVLRQEQGHFELLLDHWATFTRTPVPDRISSHVEAAAGAPEFTSIEDLYAAIAETARESASGSAGDVDTTAGMPEIPYAQPIVERTLAAAQGQLKDPAAFDHDLSRWEFSVLGSLYGWLRTQVGVYEEMGVEYSTGDVAWLLYLVSRELIPSRPKHEQMRNGRPFLLDRAASLVADRVASAARSAS